MPPATQIVRRIVAPVAAVAAVAALVFGASTARAQDKAGAKEAKPTHITQANWDLANKFSTEALRRVTFTTSVAMRTIGKTDSVWYNWKDRNGATFYVVVPATKTKKPLFDHVKLAAALATAHKKPYDGNALPFTTITWTKDHKNIRFVVDSTRYEWNLAGETIKSLGRRLRGDSIPPDEERDAQGGGRGGGGGGGGFGGGAGAEFRAWSPDSTAFVFARDHNLYFVDKGNLKDTLKISTDGEKNRTFGFRDTTAVQDTTDDQGGGGRGGAANRDPRVRANVIWSPDSKSFVIQRQDSRKVKELFLVNVLSEPRPTLSSYSYAMPGEENVAQVELWAYNRGEPKVKPVSIKKWRDQRIMNVHWTVGHDKIRLVRRDRPQRNLELVEIDIASGATKQLISEGVENANLESQAPAYVKAGGDIIWWSERTGWGHLYLYGPDGTFKRALTEGPWRVEGIAAIDSTAGVIWLNGVGREAGENLYYKHLYRVGADGSGFAIANPGNADHTPTFFPIKKYFVDNFSRVDAVPKATLRDATGKLVMELEEMDVTKLKEIGWKPPEQFVVKAADGTTDLIGNMWKPFDFDSTKKYPVVAHVYPGPQTEGVNATFQAGGVPQQLAQLGFIVVQLGNRGGTPQRSNAYQNFSYYNMRDYALADKKAGIEQLGATRKYMDLDRVGIFGHSGGGFLTAAALLSPGYNDFFKVGVSSSGNHDNNIYNQNWSEQYHGLKTVAASSLDSARGRTRAGAAGRGAPGTPGTALDTGFVDDSLRYTIKVPTNIELAANLKGKLLLTTGDMDNNVHPGNTVRLVNALIKANKRFDYMVFPGQPHGYGPMQPYFNRMLMEYFAEHLIGDYYRSTAEIKATP